MVLEGEKVVEGLFKTSDVLRLLFLQKEILGAMDERKTHVLQVRGEAYKVSRHVVGIAAIVGEFPDGNEQLLCSGNKLVGKTLLFLGIDLQIVFIVVDDKACADDDVLDVIGELLAVGLEDEEVLLFAFCEERRDLLLLFRNLLSGCVHCGLVHS